MILLKIQSYVDGSETRATNSGNPNLQIFSHMEFAKKSGLKIISLIADSGKHGRAGRRMQDRDRQNILRPGNVKRGKLDKMKKTTSGFTNER